MPSPLGSEKIRVGSEDRMTLQGLPDCFFDDHGEEKPFDEGFDWPLVRFHVKKPPQPSLCDPQGQPLDDSHLFNDEDQDEDEA